MSQTKKVFIFTSVHGPFDTRIYERQAKTLAGAGYEVTLAAPDIQAHTTPAGIQIIGLPKPRRRLGRVLNWFRFFRIARAQAADIYHFHDPDLLFAGIFLKLFTNKPVIYDNHDPYVEAILQREWLPRWLRPAISWIFDLLEKFLADKLSAIIVANDAQRLRFPQATLICNYPALEPFQSFPTKNKNPGRLIYAGSLSEPRGAFELVEIIDLLASRDVKLSILGPLSNEKLDLEMKQMVKQRGLEHLISFEGRVPYERIVSGLMEASIGLIPFRKVPDHLLIIPTKLFEYMASALPVVASDLPPIRPYMTEVNCGLLVPPENPTAFAEAIACLLDHPEEARRLGLNGRRAVIERYNWAGEAEKLLGLYHALLNRPSKA